MILLIAYISIALGVSFLCSIMEAVLLSITPGFVSATLEQRPLLGKKLKALKDDVERPLAAILSLNTIAHTVGAAGAGAQAAAVFGDAFVGIISAVLTLLILVLSEIIPKTLGAVYWRGFSGPVVRLLGPTILLMWPLVKISSALTRLIAPSKTKQINRDEFLALADLGLREGVVSLDDSIMFKNLFRFGELEATDIMTPRPVVFSLPESMTVGEAMAQYPEMVFSRIPIYATSREEVTGFVLKQEIYLEAARDNHEIAIKELKRPMPMVPAETSLKRLLDHFLSTRDHIALVLDEYGGMRGIVTLEDLLETLLGKEIVDEVDTIEDMRSFARQRWKERAAKLGILVTGEKNLKPPKEDDGGEP